MDILAHMHTAWFKVICSFIKMSHVPEINTDYSSESIRQVSRSGLQVQLVAGDPAFLSCKCN